MKSIKPGRGPSMMGGIMGIFMIFFGIVWTAIAFQGVWFMGLFGILWTCMAVIITIRNFKNATSKNRYSTYDIVDANEEPDPFNERFGNNGTEAKQKTPHRYCPYCGNAVASDHEYCSQCGRRLS